MNWRKCKKLFQNGWPDTEEGGNFYPRSKSVFSWYYYVYINRSQSGEVNHAASACLRKPVRGQIIVVRSGPRGAKYDDSILQDDLIDAILFCSEVNPKQIFQEREAMRAMQARNGHAGSTKAVYLGAGYLGAMSKAKR
eukprot:TRINITY_DN10088_c0_g1_i1.p1 TRINITY_DN10088_c0_g1~~TRINITY_DN10088_c0_g1_i1.p1  ORF type:complete len:138 (+),score=5.29 TRINITY_DN10088_c0_g1_i1:132-545(+)